jgi:hypothetical protein
MFYTNTRSLVKNVQASHMPPAENTALVCRFYEGAWANGDLDVIDELFADDYVRHDLRPTRPVPGPEGMKQITPTFGRRFPTSAPRSRSRSPRASSSSPAGPPRGHISAVGAPPSPPDGAPRSRPPTSSGSRTQRSSRSGTTATTSGWPSSSAYPSSRARPDREARPASAVRDLDRVAVRELVRPPHPLARETRRPAPDPCARAAFAE